MKRSLVLLLLLLAACGVQDAQVGSVSDEGQATAAPLTAPEATLAFNSNWTITASGPLVEGGKVRVVYDGTRLPECRGDDNGRPAWAITGYAQVNDGPVQPLELGGLSPSGATTQPVVDLPAGGRVAFWFQVTNKWGCSAWDSNFGRNFVFDITAQSRIVFARDWSEAVSGPLSAPTLLVDYDLSRLPSCRQGYNGLATWEILVNWRFDGGPVQYTPVTRTIGPDRVANPASISVPAGAREIELWFKASDRAGCVQFDSDFGRNYRWRLN